jgi:hypothetical protein
MGIKTTRALQARRRESDAHIERLVARADERSPIGSARRARIKDGARLVRRQIRALATAKRAVTTTEVEIGHGLLRILDQGISRNEAFELAGLSRHHGRRYVDLALRAQSQIPAGPSTTSAADIGPRTAGNDPHHHVPHAEATEPGRKL